MESSLHAVCDMPSTSGLRILLKSLTMSQPSHPFYSIQTSSNWLGSSWTVTPGYLSLSARNVTQSSTNVTASSSGFCRESTFHLLEKRTQKASESTCDFMSPPYDHFQVPTLFWVSTRKCLSLEQFYTLIPLDTSLFSVTCRVWHFCFVPSSMLLPPVESRGQIPCL